MQQVNLYLPEFHPKRELLSFTQLGFAILIVVFVFIALGYMESTKTSVMQKQLEQEKNNLASLRLQLNEIEATLANRPTENDIDDKIKSLQAELQNKSLAVNTLRNADISASAGFSELVRDLAKHTERRIWLTEIKLVADALELQGQTTEPELVAWWIESSKAYDSLRRNFSSVSIKENSNNKNVYDFHLKNGVAVSNE